MKKIYFLLVFIFLLGCREDFQAEDNHSKIYGDYMIYLRGDSNLIYDNFKEEVLISDKSANEYFPFEKNVVFLGLDSNLYDYNLLTGKIKNLSSDGSRKNYFTADKYGMVVWIKDYDLFYYDLDELKQITFTTNPSMEYFPRVDREMIVWYGRTDGIDQIFFYKNKIVQVTNEESNQNDPRVYNNRIVYESEKNGKVALFMYDGGIEQINDYGNIKIRDLYGSNLIYTNNDVLYLYNLDDKKEYELGRNTSNQIVSENFVAWLEFDGDYELYTFDVDKKEKKRITDDNLNDREPYLYENKLTWTKEGEINFERLS